MQYALRFSKLKGRGVYGCGTDLQGGGNRIAGKRSLSDSFQNWKGRTVYVGECCGSCDHHADAGERDRRFAPDYPLTIWIMSFLAVCGLVLAVMLFLLLIRQFRPELAPPLNLCITLFLTLSAIASIIPLVSYLQELELGKFELYLPYLMKSMGISLLSTTAADLCRDSGESAVATKQELLGKCEIVLLSIPLLKELLTLAHELMRFS